MKKLCAFAFVFAMMASSAFAGPQDFTLTNNSASDICFLYISPSSSNDWEEDVLGAEECLGSGESVDVIFNGSAEAAWDLAVEDLEGGREVYSGINLMEVSEVIIQGGGKAGLR